VTDVVFIDTNNAPVLINNLNDFFEAISAQYLHATNEYFTKFSDLRVKRKISAILEL
jgi:hypothetical protein